MSNYGLRKNMLLYCRDGQTVILYNYSREFVWVRYKGKIYRRPIEAINQTLFLDDPTHNEKLSGDNKAIGEKKWFHQVRKNSDRVERLLPSVDENEKERKTCMTCRFQRLGECFSSEVCADYEPAYIIPKEERDAWPKYGDATILSRRKHKKTEKYS